MMSSTFLRTLRAGALAGAALLTMAGGALAAGEAAQPDDQDWHFEGIFGTYDLASAQRGLQVYLNVCAGCHGLRQVAYRNLDLLGFSEAEIKAIAANYQVQDGPDDQGEMFDRAAIPSDRFVDPFPNKQAAAASNGGAVPPDLSLQAKAHAAGPDYIYALLVGYEAPPADFNVQPGLYYNAYFPGNLIAMPPPLAEGSVEYTDGSEATVEQMAWDVTNFMMWAADPKMEQRKRTGYKVIIFLVILAAVLYAAKKKLWSDQPH